MLGTVDDTFRAAASGNVRPQLLIADSFRPRKGHLFTIKPDLASGLSLEIILRMNARGLDNEFLMEEDYIFSQKVTLRQ